MSNFLKHFSELSKSNASIAGGKGASLGELIAETTSVSTYVAEDPIFCAVKGTGTALENIDNYKRSILATR
ncbi:MAG: hypothetical protein WC457_03400 [Patescibacteria group bacterium]